jgi:hypothetical protein
VSKWWKSYPLPLLGPRNAPLKGFKLSLRSDPCAYCKEPAESIDHIVPVSKKGENRFYNFTGACQPCNSRKSDRSLLEFLLLERDRIGFG